ncbi:glycosyl hydrolase [Aureococcus anophagefferens]|nr:glycosyl hydrolase [Aureococcus anophagefferens]
MLQRFVAIFQYKGADPPDQLFPFPVVPEGAVDEARIVALPRSQPVVRSEAHGLQIGSETVGNISDILFHNVTVLGAAKAAMSIVTMDGSHISRVRYERIRAQNVQALAFIVVGARLRRPGIGDAQVVMDEWIGTISDVSINNVLAHNVSAPNAWKGCSYNYSTHLDGLAKGRWTSGSKRSVPAYEALENHPLGPRISITNVRGGLGQGEAAMKLWEPAHNPKSYVERNVGPSPAFGAFVRNAVDVTLEKWDVRAAHNDDRPAFVFDGVRGNRLVNSAADRGAASAFDVGLRNAADVAVHGGLKPSTRAPSRTPRSRAAPSAALMSDADRRAPFQSTIGSSPSPSVATREPTPTSSGAAVRPSSRSAA